MTDLTGAAEINLTCEPEIDRVMHVSTEIGLAEVVRVIHTLIRMPPSVFGPRQRASCGLEPDEKSALMVPMGHSTRPTCLSGLGSPDGTIPVQRVHPS